MSLGRGMTGLEDIVAPDNVIVAIKSVRMGLNTLRN